MTYSYSNNSDHAISFRSILWLPGETIDTDSPVPDNLGLTCLRQGNPPDPVLMHDNYILEPDARLEIDIPAPNLSHNVALDIRDMSLDSGVTCSFGSQDNSPIPIDTRDFSHVLAWELCSRIFIHNPTDLQAVISLTALEVVA